jgi:hypothetical protein
VSAFEVEFDGLYKETELQFRYFFSKPTTAAIPATVILCATDADGGKQQSKTH